MTVQEKEAQTVGLVGAADDRVTGCIVLAASREPDEKNVKGYMQDRQDKNGMEWAVEAAFYEAE